MYMIKLYIWMNFIKIIFINIDFFNGQEDNGNIIICDVTKRVAH